MKRFFIILPILFIAFSSFLVPVHAESIGTGKIDDTLYDIQSIDVNQPNAIASTVNGFNVSMYYNAGSGNVGYTNSFTPPKSGNYTILFEMYMPKKFDKGTYLDVTFKLYHYSNIKVNSVSKCVFFNDAWTLSTLTTDFKIEDNGTYFTLMNTTPIKLNSQASVIQLTLNCTVTDTKSCALYPNTIEIGTVDGSAANTEVIESQLDMLLYMMEYNVVGSLTCILEAWNAYLQNFSNWIHECCLHLGDILNNMSEVLDSAILGVKNAVIDIGSNIVSGISDMKNAVTGKLDDLLNYFKGDENTDNTVNDNTASNNELDSTVNEYDQLENGIIQDFNTNIGNIDTTNNLFGLGDFISTGTFISTQMTNLYTSNMIVQYMITFGLILGIALTVIGISTKR